MLHSYIISPSASDVIAQQDWKCYLLDHLLFCQVLKVFSKNMRESEIRHVSPTLLTSQVLRVKFFVFSVQCNRFRSFSLAIRLFFIDSRPAEKHGIPSIAFCCNVTQNGMRYLIINILMYVATLQLS